MLNKFFEAINKVVYDPIKGRISYDLIISIASSGAITIIYTFFQQQKFNLLFFYYSILFVLINWLLGLYTKQKSSNLATKLLILLIADLITYISLNQIFSLYFISSLLFVVIGLSASLPRFFLNFNVDKIKLNSGKSNKKELPVLIVGGGGYIGSPLVEKLLKRGEKVRVFDKFIYSKEIFNKINNSKNLELIQGDISDIYQLTLAVKDTKAVIHLAGIVGDPAARLDEKLTRHVNIASTRLLKETAKAFGVEKFIFASSCSVYGAAKSIQNEKSKPKPISLYAKTKVDSEKELLTDRSDNFYPIILRFSTVFGHSIKPRFDLVANLFTAEAFKNKLIKVYGGDQWRPLIHVEDVAEAIILALDAPNEKVSRQIFNVGDNKNNIKIIELANIVKKLMKDRDVKIKVISNKKDKRDYRVSFDKIQTVLGFNSKISIEKGLLQIYSNLKNNKYKYDYKDPFFTSLEKTKELKKEFRSKKYKSTHFSTIS